jgi:RNA polymerase sigma-70 factor (ECF subfamily)
MIRKGMTECIRGIVDSLPENYRSVLVLSELQGLTSAEIAEVLGMFDRLDERGGALSFEEF